jgi:hypothetical protein
MVDETSKNVKKQVVQEEIPDETGHLFLYANLKITDKDTGEIIINKPC